ncbi:MAG: hypothetical protein WD638_05680, partial [Nitriliruptoraceae bacterium]
MDDEVMDRDGSVAAAVAPEVAGVRTAGRGTRASAAPVVSGGRSTVADGLREAVARRLQDDAEVAGGRIDRAA